MTAVTARFRAAYRRALRAFLDDGTETSLRAAYELGRDAVTHELGLLDLVHTHHEVLFAELEASPQRDDAREIIRAGADFLLEALSAFEMVRRGFTEAREAVISERRQAAMLRQLSTLLADASLVVHARSSVREVLQLVAEQARELTHARWCLASAASVLGDPSRTSAHAGTAPGDLDELARAAFAAVAPDTAPTHVVSFETRAGGSGGVAAPLTALDGRPIGVLAIGSRAGLPFSELDKAMLVHVAQVTAAAIERAARYRPGG